LETSPGPSDNRDFCAAVWGNPRVIFNVGGPVNEQTPVSQAKSLGRSLLLRLLGRRYRREAQKRIRASRSVAESVDCFICPSPFLRKTFIDHGFPENKLILSDYGIRPIGATTLRRPVKYPLRFTYIGTLVRHKGAHILVRAFNELAPERAVLRIYGPTDEFVDYVRMLQSLVRNPSIEFRGRFENQDVAGILGETDVLVVPSIWFENSPITIHEAFLAGVPVITARFGGMADLVTDGVNGLLFEVGDVRDLRRALLRFVDDPGLVGQLRPDPSLVKSLEENGKEMENLYQSLCLGRRREENEHHPENGG
jgi:glycosyltransferase involved in cell wall biosynthesis